MLCTRKIENNVYVGKLNEYSKLGRKKLRQNYV